MSRHYRSRIRSDRSFVTRFDHCNELDFLIRCFRNAYVRALRGATPISEGRTGQEEVLRCWNHLLNRMFTILVAEGLVDPYIEGEEENDDIVADHSG